MRAAWLEDVIIMVLPRHPWYKIGMYSMVTKVGLLSLTHLPYLSLLGKGANLDR
jgi:hypothetical protein